MERLVAYIENNPVKAGLVAEASQSVWSSAWKGDPDRGCGLKPAAARSSVRHNIGSFLPRNVQTPVRGAAPPRDVFYLTFCPLPFAF